MSPTWTVTRRSPNNFRVDVQVAKLADVFSVFLASDVHWDHPKCDQALFSRHLSSAAARNMPVVLVGDFFDAMQGRNDKRGSKSDLRPEHKEGNYLDALVDTAAEFLEPFKQHITVVGYGNHETSVLKNSETDLLSRLQQRLGIDVLGGYGGYIEFCFWYAGLLRCRHLMKYFHGSGGGGAVTKGAIGVNRRAVIYPDADSVVTGHVHDRLTVSYVTERYNPKSGKTELRTCEHIQLPTYKDEYAEGFIGWHVERGAPPKPVGGVELQFKLISPPGEHVYRAVGTPVTLSY